jgi:hypothetical protein
MGTIVRTIIQDTDIGRLFLPGPGETAWNWMERAAREQMTQTLKEVPRRTNALASSLNIAILPNGYVNCFYSIGSYSDYAPYVIFGTKHVAPIRPKGSWTDADGNAWLWIRPFPHSWWMGGGGIEHVAGQDANNFLDRGSKFMLAKYGPGW